LELDLAEKVGIEVLQDGKPDVDRVHERAGEDDVGFAQQVVRRLKRVPHGLLLVAEDRQIAEQRPIGDGEPVVPATGP
jgi:hypothetical protein